MILKQEATKTNRKCIMDENNWNIFFLVRIIACVIIHERSCCLSLGSVALLGWFFTAKSHPAQGFVV